MPDARIAFGAIAYAAIYVGGLALLYFQLAGELEGTTSIVAAGWSLACGLATVRFEALLVPTGIISTVALVTLATADGLTTYDSGPLVLLFYPLLLGIAMAVLVLPMGAGVLISRLLRPNQVDRSGSLLASLEQKR